MGNVIKLGPQIRNKATLLIIQALEYEKIADPFEPINILVVSIDEKLEVRQKLNCMAPSNSRIRVLTVLEFRLETEHLSRGEN